ncbi:MAG: DUF4838 domain-containing protein [Lentisphaeria bacterium]|nr:DUF4838 domain-containing protein [Lentisphaeria bacterium]
MKKLTALLLLGSLALWGAGKPVGIWQQGNDSLRLGFLLRDTALNPQWSPDKPEVKACSGKNFGSFDAVIYLHGPKNGMKFREWKKENIAAAEKYVENGGLLIILADGTGNPGGSAGAFAKLLGAKTWSTFTGRAEIADAGWKECGTVPQVFDYMLGGKMGFAALKDLTTARGLIGNGSGWLAVENRLGQGRVIFLNARLTESLTPYIQPYNRHANAALEQLFPFMKKIHAELMSVSPALSREKRELWDYRPTGPEPDKSARKKPQVRKVVSSRKYEELPSDPLTLIEDGVPKAVIVLRKNTDKPGARLLNDVLKKMSGVELPTAMAGAVSEDGGKWKWHSKRFDLKIEFESAPKISIRAEGNLIRIGAPSLPLGIYSFLREALGYRMLWPGESGEVFKTGKTVAVKPFALTDAPFFKQRYIRNSLIRKPTPWKAPDGKVVKIPLPDEIVLKSDLTGFDPRKVLNARKDAGRTWVAAQRLGGSIGNLGGKSFYDWQKRFGKTHPEYMALQFNGTRRMGGDRTRICKANPDVIRQAAADARDFLAKKPDAVYYNLSPSDGGYDIFCMCPLCRAWDPTGAPEKASRVFLKRNRPVYLYPRLTDRVFRFTCEVARELRKTHPKIKVRYLAYAQYLTPPEYYRDVPDNISVTFVGLEYLNTAGLERDRRYWDIWAGIAQDMVLRPNNLLSGAGLPIIFPHEMGRDLLHCAETGMVGGDFSSLIHHWATQGLNYYVLAQMLWDPTQKVDDIIDDYCTSGFGPAAPELKAYFERCEKLSREMADRKAENLKQIEDLTEEVRETLMDTFMRVFNDAEMKALAELLDRARTKTAEGSPERKRVEFITAGFRFTQGRVDFYRKYAASKSKKELKDTVNEQWRAWQEMFRAQPYAVNVPLLAVSQYYTYWRNCGWKAEPIRDEQESKEE